VASGNDGKFWLASWTVIGFLVAVIAACWVLTCLLVFLWDD
jgi:hypothetical protein